MTLTGRCAVCGYDLEFDPARLHREIAICLRCHSSPRFCGLARAVTQVVYSDAANQPLCAQPERKDLVVIGISDDERLASIFRSKFEYINTFYHTEPLLDICSLDSCLRYRADLVTCSDVLEHTFAPPIVPLNNIFAMLREGGALIVSVPSFLCESTIEWYGGVQDIEITEEQGRHLVRWRNRRGTEYIDPDPVFHGGPGQTLELRIISHPEFLAIARAVGFVGDTLDFALEWGYLWPIVRHRSYVEECADSRVIVLRRPRSS